MLEISWQIIDDDTLVAGNLFGAFIGAGIEADEREAFHNCMA
jgi:hypothetical protein